MECIRLSLVFHGFADILPFLTMFNMPPMARASPQISSPRGRLPNPNPIPPRPDLPPRMPMNVNPPAHYYPRPEQHPRNPMNHHPRMPYQQPPRAPRNPPYPQPPRDYLPRPDYHPRPPINPPGDRQPRPGYQPRPPMNAPGDRHPRNHPRDMYIPRPMPPRPSFEQKRR